MTSEMHSNAFQCIAQPNTTLADCIRILYLTLTQCPYDPGTLPKLCKSVHPWERVSEIQSIKGTTQYLLQTTMEEAKFNHIQYYYKHNA